MAIHPAAQRLAELLLQRNTRVVFAESCTAGLVSAMLAAVPGISSAHCGSAVTYREGTKMAWLDVSEASLAEHTAVSEAVGREMAVGVLARTPEAEYSAAITGHLGPDAPPDLDGVVFIAVAHRDADGPHVVGLRRYELGTRTRELRQQEAAVLVLEQLRALLESFG